MRKIIIAALTMLTLGATQADYTLKIPLDAIKFKEPQPPAVPSGPWDCVNQAEAYPEECEKRLNAWEKFADDNGLSKNWNNLNWNYKNLTSIPSEPYPLTSVGNIYLGNNQLTNVEGLRNLTSVGSIYLNYNQLTNVEGLINLTSVGIITLDNNKLTNVDGLINLTSVGGTLNLTRNQLTNVEGLRNLTSVGIINLNDNQLTNVEGLRNLTSVGGDLSLKYNQLTNINGLANVAVLHYTRIDPPYSGPKLPALSRFCTLTAVNKFVGIQKIQLCETP